MLGTITIHINIEKLNERGKKRLNAKLEHHLARPHTLPYEVSAFIYIYIYIDFFATCIQSGCSRCAKHPIQTFI